jgi:hypothetical protein
VRHYTTQKLGPNREKTPEGFLLCRNVPIARTGVQLYGPGETPISDGGTGRIQVHRRPEDVFRNITMESFNGKPVTLDHPGMDVTPENWKELAVGFVLDTRRGQGMEDDLLLADMLITDSEAIRAVLEDGLDEVSCGYDAEYEEEVPGIGYQVGILGNHVALVEAGRCGHRCSIRDSEDGMNNTSKTLRERIVAAFAAKDEKGLTDALDALPTPGADETHIHIHAATNDSATATAKDEKKDEKETKDEVLTSDSAVLQAIAALDTKVSGQLASFADRLNKMEDAKKDEDDEDDEDDEEEEEKTKDAADGDDEEEGKTKDAADSQEEEELAIERAMNPAVDSTREQVEPTKAKDSRYLEHAISETLAAAEILSPGISFPTFDQAHAPAKTTATLDSLRRKSLLLASSTPMGAAVIAELRGGRPLTGKSLKKMSAKDVRTLFRAASGHMKLHNRSQHDNKSLNVSVPKGPVTIADINRRNREFWGERVG